MADPIFITVNETRHKLTWWYNGYDVDYYSRGGRCWAYRGFTTWYISTCYYPWAMWYSYNSTSSWIGNELRGGYRNYDFGNYSLATRTSSFIRIWGYQNGYGGYKLNWRRDGEYWWLIHPDAYTWYS